MKTCDACGQAIRPPAAILAYLAAHGPAKTAEINAAVGLTGQFACAYLNALRKRGDVRKVSYGVWAVTKGAR